MSVPLNRDRGLTRRLAHPVLGAFSLLLALASLAQYGAENRLRWAAERFDRAFSIDARWRSVSKAMRLEPSGDLASDVVVEAALGDSAISAVPRGSDPPARDARFPSAAERSRELESARDLMLDAIAARPGWAQHRLLLGRAVNAAAKEQADGEVARRPELWAQPLRQAGADAPGVDAIWTALARAYLESWSTLSGPLRSEARDVLRRAFFDPEFVSRGFLPTARGVGLSEAMSLLPENPQVLELAARALSRDGDVRDAALLFLRRDQAERQKRAEDLREIEELHRRGDMEGLRPACLDWISQHPARDFDDRAGRAQVARLLELWPSDEGSWRDDPRGRIVRFFLDGRESDVRGATALRSIESLTGVPRPILARARLLAGDLQGAQDLAAESQDHGPEWRPYFVELARLELRRGRTRDARKALASTGVEGREDCGVLTTRRDLARALGDAADLAAVDKKLQTLRMSSHAAETRAGSSEATLFFCLDPEWSRGKTLIVEVEVAAPALLDYGWDAGRSGSVWAGETSTIVRLPLAGLSGRRSLTVSSRIGGPVRVIRAAVAEPS